MKSRLIVLLSLLCSALITSPDTSAQSYPSKPIRVIVPYAPGGGTDLFARKLAAALSDALGQQVLIENRAGAQGSIGVVQVAKAPADGYTILLTDIGSLGMTPWLYKNPAYDPVKDFAHISLGVAFPYAVVVHPGVPAKNLKHLAALAKAKPDQLTIGYSSVTSQLTGELFKIVAGVTMLQVPYKGGALAIIDLVGGHVDVAFASAASFVPMVKSGKTRALAVTGPKRIPALPDVLTSTESGFPNFEVVGWTSLAAPTNTPKDVIARLNRAVVNVLKTPTLIDDLVLAGFEPVTNSPEEMTDLVKSDYARWGKVIKTAGIIPR